jgi:hypothetical protein
MSCMGAFIGLRCTARARPFQGVARLRWLLLGGVSIGVTGVWLMHFIAMLGFTIPGETIHYNVPVTILSLLVAVVIVCVGLVIVGFSPNGYGPLLLGGLITGIGVAIMHYLGMAAMRMPGRITYNPGLLVLSIAIAIVAGDGGVVGGGPAAGNRAHPGRLADHGRGGQRHALCRDGGDAGIPLGRPGGHDHGRRGRRNSRELPASADHRHHRHLIRADGHHGPVGERG